MTVKLTGMSEIERKLATMPKKAKGILRSSTNDLAADMRKVARSMAPKRSGTLRRAIKTKRRRGRRDEIRVSLYVEHGSGAKNDAWWWHFVEFGTVKQPQHPYLRPAYNRTKQEVSRGSFQKKVWARISKAVLK